MTAKKCIKKHDACVKLLFCQSKRIAFLPFLLPSLLLKLPIEETPKVGIPDLKVAIIILGDQ